MKYGVSLTRHVLRQVFGNLGQAARITLAPILGFFLLFYLVAAGPLTELVAALATANEATDPSQIDLPTNGLGVVLLLIPVGLIVFSWVAVGWHRYVLLEEYPLGVVPRWSFDRVLGYLGRSIVVGAILIGIAIASSFVSIAIASALGGAVIGLLLLGVAILLSWCFVRMGLILPATAIDERLSIGESWGITGRASSEILVPILAFAFGFGLAGQLVALALGQSILATFASGALSWLQMLCNLALLTTLYGNLVQRRDLVSAFE